jgi:hypothetical protein
MDKDPFELNPVNLVRQVQYNIEQHLSEYPDLDSNAPETKGFLEGMWEIVSVDNETPVFFTHAELTQLNRIFNIIGEEALRANYFTKSDIEDVYSVLEKVRTAKEQLELENEYAK